MGEAPRAGQSMTALGKMKGGAARAGGVHGRTPRGGLWMARDEAGGTGWEGSGQNVQATVRMFLFLFLKFNE